MPEKRTDNPRDCPLFPRVEALERANEQHGSTHRELFDRARELEAKPARRRESITGIAFYFGIQSQKVQEVLEGGGNGNG